MSEGIKNPRQLIWAQVSKQKKIQPENSSISSLSPTDFFSNDTFRDAHFDQTICVYKKDRNF